MDKKELNLEEMNKVTGGAFDFIDLMAGGGECEQCGCPISPSEFLAEKSLCRACREKLQNASPLGVRH